MVHGSRVAPGAESWLRRRPRAAAKNCCPCPSAPWRAGAAVGERLPERVGTFQEGTAWRATQRRGGGPHGGRAGAGHAGRRRRGGRERGGRLMALLVGPVAGEAHDF